MKIIILRSSFQTDEFVRNEYAELIQRLENECHAEINIMGDESVETRLIAINRVSTNVTRCGDDRYWRCGKPFQTHLVIH